VNLNAPFALNNGEQFISQFPSASPEDAKHYRGSLMHAYMARATAKSLGGSQFVFYHENMKCPSTRSTFFRK